MRPAGIHPRREQLQRIVTELLHFGRGQLPGIGQLAHQFGIAACGQVAFAVDEDVLRVVKHAGALVQAHVFDQTKVVGRLKPHAGFGVTQGFAQGAFQRQGLGQGFFQRLAGKVQQGCRNFARVGHRRLLGVFVHHILGAFIGRIGQAQKQFTRQLVLFGGAKTDGVRHALALGNAVVRPHRGQVEHVAGLQHVFFFGLEVGEDFQRHIGLQAEVFLPPNAPAALAMGLQQEHIVVVKVWANAALVGGKADHQIIKPCIRNKAKRLQQLVRGLHVQIHALHQHRPARLFQRGQAPARKRAVRQAPLPAALLLHQARFDAVLSRQVQQLGAAEQRLETGDSLAHQQGLFMPVGAHELGGGDTAKKS